MTNLKKKYFSLLPYLNNNGFHIRLITNRRKTKPVLPGHSYFVSVTQRDPLVNILKAKLVTTTGKDIQDLFLVLSKDNYDSDINPRIVTNGMIEDIWSKSYAFYRTRKTPFSPFLIGESKDDNNKVIPKFRSLFYCNKKNIYFHPPCPTCGNLLELADDDKFLNLYGLPSYSSSIERFLVCPICCSKGDPHLFVKDIRDVNKKTKANVMDKDQLIWSWRHLATNQELHKVLPCAGCNEAGSCFGEKKKVFYHLQPLAFYPFFLFVFKAPEMEAYRYLEMISGKKSSQNISSNRTDFFFSETDKQWFYEVLFLKLSLLQQVLRDLNANRTEYPCLGTNLIEKLWIHIPALPGQLPNAWAYSPVFVGLLGDGRLLQMPRPSANHLLMDFAILWFHVLCTNKNNNIGVVNEALEEIIAFVENGNQLPFHKVSDKVRQILAPQALIWHPVKFVVDEQAQQLWQHAMDIGIKMIERSLSGLITTDLEDFSNEISQLSSKVKQCLFSISFTKEQAQTWPQSQQKDHEIVTILDEIIHKWQKHSSLSKRKQFFEKVMSEQVPDVEIGGQQVPEQNYTENISDIETLPLYEENEDILPETVIISKQDEQTEQLLNQERKAITQDDGSLTSKDLHRPRESQEDFLEETVILRPSDKDNQGK